MYILEVCPVVYKVCVYRSIDCTRKWIGNAAPRTLRDVIGHPPYGHGALEIGGSQRICASIVGESLMSHSNWLRSTSTCSTR